MDRFIIQSSELWTFLSSVKEERELVGPVARSGGQHAFQVIDHLQDLVLDYVHTILPPKKYFLPQREVLLAFHRGGEVSARAVNDVKPRVLVGVHPCDLAGIRHLDLSFSGESEDWNYQAKRRQSVVIGVDCLPDDSCFCESVGTMRPESGFDLFFLDLGNRWMVMVGTDTGSKLLEEHGPQMRPAGADDVDALQAHYREKRELQKARLHADVRDLPMLFEGTDGAPVWKQYGERCLGCGTCTNVCPTCYCFDIDDEVEVNLTDGTRKRVWDSCQLRDFTRVAGDEVFREKLSLRVRHRVYRKFRYLHRKFNEPNCTGCGRCSRQCVAGIRMNEVVNDLVASSLTHQGGGER